MPGNLFSVERCASLPRKIAIAIAKLRANKFLGLILVNIYGHETRIALHLVRYSFRCHVRDTRRRARRLGLKGRHGGTGIRAFQEFIRYLEIFINILPDPFSPPFIPPPSRR